MPTILYAVKENRKKEDGIAVLAKFFAPPPFFCANELETLVSLVHSFLTCQSRLHNNRLGHSTNKKSCKIHYAGTIDHRRLYIVNRLCCGRKRGQQPSHIALFASSFCASVIFFFFFFFLYKTFWSLIRSRTLASSNPTVYDYTSLYFLHLLPASTKPHGLIQWSFPFFSLFFSLLFFR